jgi:hypothetical protein
MKLRDHFCANSILYVSLISKYVVFMKYNKGFIVNKQEASYIILDRLLGCPCFIEGLVLVNCCENY